MPAAGWGAAAPARVCHDLQIELQRPAADRPIADIDSALRQQLLDVPEAERKRIVETDRVADHIRREPVTFERERPHIGIKSQIPIGRLGLDADNLLRFHS